MIDNVFNGFVIDVYAYFKPRPSVKRWPYSTASTETSVQSVPMPSTVFWLVDRSFVCMCLMCPLAKLSKRITTYVQIDVCKLIKKNIFEHSLHVLLSL